MEIIIFIQTRSDAEARRKFIRDVAAFAYTLAVTLSAGKWVICMAYLERGYEAAGGEYVLIPVIYWMEWKIINSFFDALEDLKYEQKCKKERGRRTSRI